MIPIILIGAGAYLIAKSFTKEKFAKGGALKYYDKDTQHRIGRPSASIEKDILEKVKYYSSSDEFFVGSFGWKTPSGKLADGYLYKLNDYDENLVKNIKLKPEERIFLYFNRTTAIGGMTPMIKINLDKELLYFLDDNSDDEIVFKTRGVQALWIALIEDKMADGGEVGQLDKKGRKIVGYEVEYEKLVDGEREPDIKSFKIKEDAEAFAKENYGYVESFYEGQYKMSDGGYMAKGGMVVTSIKDIPNFKKRLEERKITYRGMGMGKKSDNFYDLAGEHGVSIKVDGKEYHITDTEFNSFSRGSDGKLIIRFDAPYRKSYADGGMTDWQTAKIGDSALVISENKLGLIIKDYGRKFHLKFPDGREKTYDASELNFMKFDDEFADGGIMARGSDVLKQIYDYISNTKYSMMIDDYEEGEYITIKDRVAPSITSGDSYDDLVNKIKLFASDLKDRKWGDLIDIKFDYYDEWVGFDIILKENDKMANGGMMAKGGEVENKINNLYIKSNFINDDFNWKLKLLEMLQDGSSEAYNIYQSLTESQKEAVLQELFEMDNDMGGEGDGEIETSKENLDILLEDAKSGKKYASGGMMAMGGVTFEDKVKSIKKSLLKGKKVSPSVQKDYGKTYSAAEAEESARRIVGSMTKKRKYAHGGGIKNIEVKKEDGTEIEISKEEDLEKNTYYSVYYEKNDMEIQGDLIPYNTRKGTEYEFSTNSFNSKDTKDYYSDHYQEIIDEILKVFYENAYKSIK